MRTSETGLRMIKGFEGLRLRAYADPVGILTIGYGHTGPDVVARTVISAEEAERLLREDLHEAEAAVDELVDVPLRQSQFDALVSFAFNLGRGSLASSTLLKRLNAGDMVGAAAQFQRWVHGTSRGRKVVLPGLVRRRTAERAMFVGAI